MAPDKVAGSFSHEERNASELPDGWKWARLGDTSEVTAGQSPPGKSYNTDGIGTEFHQGKAAFGGKYLEHSGKWTTDPRRLAKSGDVVMSVRAPVGPVNLVDRCVAIGRGLASIRVYPERLKSEWLFHYLCSIESEITGTQGSTFASINKAQIEEIRLPLAPLIEQTRILDGLSERLRAIEEVRLATLSQRDAIESLPAVYLRNAFIGDL